MFDISIQLTPSLVDLCHLTIVPLYPFKINVPEFVTFECVFDETEPPTGGVPEVTVINLPVE